MFIMLILFLSTYLVFWTYSRIEIYYSLYDEMWYEFYDALPFRLEAAPRVEMLFYSLNSNKLYEDFLWNCLPVVGELRWWRARPR